LLTALPVWNSFLIKNEMNKYTYYVFIDAEGNRFAQPVYTSRRESMDRQARMFAEDNDCIAAIGPFKTRRAAEFMAGPGANNPHCRSVNDAENLSKNNIEE